MYPHNCLIGINLYKILCHSVIIYISRTTNYCTCLQYLNIRYRLAKLTWRYIYHTHLLLIKKITIFLLTVCGIITETLRHWDWERERIILISRIYMANKVSFLKQIFTLLIFGHSWELNTWTGANNLNFLAHLFCF